MTPLFVRPHALGVVVQTHLPAGELEVMGSDGSILLIEGDLFGVLTFRARVALASDHGGVVDADELCVD